MGKGQSAVFTVLFTVIIAVLCAMCVVPTFTLPFNVGGSVTEYRSVLEVMNLDADLGGGYSTVYYPEGVISSAEYDAEYEAKKEVSDTLAEEYADGYVQHGSLYLEKDITENGDADADFKEDFETAVDVIAARYEALNLDYVKVEVADDYTIRIELSTQVSDPSTVFALLSYSGDFTLRTSTRTLPLLRPTNNYGMDTYFKKVSVRTSSGSPYVKFSLTSTGKDKVSSITETVAADEDDPTLYFYVGENSIISLSLTEAITDSVLYVSGYEDELTAQCVAVLFNSCINDETVNLEFTVDSVSTAEPLMSEDMPTALYIGFGVCMLAMFIYSVIRYRGIGAAHIYGFLSYMICAVMCVSLIESVQLSLGGVLAVMLGGVLMTVSNYYMFGNVKAEFDSGKRIVASVKEGYKKSLALVIDVHVVLLVLSGILYFAGISSVSLFGATFALCTIISAACSLGLTRFYWAMLMGNVKNQFKFCHFKREVTDDDDE